MTLTAKQAWAIGNLIHELRPDWDAAGVVKQLERIRDRNQFIVALACIRAAQDPDARTPGVIPTDGTHWQEGLKKDRDSGRPPKKAEECATHAGNWADACFGCAADQKAGDQTTRNPRRLPPPDTYRAARAALHPHHTKEKDCARTETNR